jgi:hypothetical protein
LISIAGLGELFTNALNLGLKSKVFDVSLPTPIGISWRLTYLEAKGSVEAQMIDANWCRSDVERIRQLYQGLSTQHFLSHLGKAPSGLSHASCSFQRCEAAQIKKGTYVLSHAEGCKSCEVLGVDETEVKNILLHGESFPILRIEAASGNGIGLEIRVEEYTSDKPYVAISHVGHSFMLLCLLSITVCR